MLTEWIIVGIEYIQGWSIQVISDDDRKSPGEVVTVPPQKMLSRKKESTGLWSNCLRQQEIWHIRMWFFKGHLLADEVEGFFLSFLLPVARRSFREKVDNLEYTFSQPIHANNIETTDVMCLLGFTVWNFDNNMTSLGTLPIWQGSIA